MAISATIKITNKTKELIKITKSEKGEGTSWVKNNQLEVGTVILQDETKSIFFGNASVIPPRGCAYDISFDSNSHGGWVNFNDPVVGKHSFDLGNKEYFNFEENELSNTVYEIVISSK